MTTMLPAPGHYTGSVDGVVLALEVTGERVVFRLRVGFPGRGVSVEFLARP